MGLTMGINGVTVGTIRSDRGDRVRDLGKDDL